MDKPPCTECSCYTDLKAQLDDIRRDLDAYSESKERQIATVHSDMNLLRTEVHDLRGDVRSLATSISGIEKSLQVIAASMSNLSDLPVVWNKVKGFWAVMNWIRTNALTLLLTVVIAALAARMALAEGGLLR